MEDQTQPHPTSFRLSEQEINMLDILAHAENRSRNAELRSIIRSTYRLWYECESNSFGFDS